MPTQLTEIPDAWDKETGEGRDEELTRSLADAYVTENPAEFAELEALSLEDLVKAVDVFRAAGLTDSQLRVEAWIFHSYKPQNIGGTYSAELRVLNG